MTTAHDRRVVVTGMAINTAIGDDLDTYAGYINAHATSTPLGDVTEIDSIKRVLGNHAYRLKINATKSMVGHACWSAPVVETVAGLLQLNGGLLHPSINIEQRDPGIDLDVCEGGAVEHDARIMMKNSFGFGGINCCALYRRFEADPRSPDPGGTR
jgi:3-oxoacyl-(acyl-carrier-protein) synthase